MKQELTFKSRARIIRTLGDQLISGEVAAIIELVKDAYDADANSCFIEINPQKGSITIRDNGHGMSLKDVQEKWAELGTDNKLRNNISKSGKRQFLGNKGIGRLAASKLGRNLKINSTIKEGNRFKSIQVDELNWDDFSERKNSYIEDIKFYVEEIEAGNQSGTTLIISYLSQKWAEEKLKGLVRELRKLMSPISQDDNDFNIYLDIDSFTVEQNGFDGSEIVNGRQTLVSKLNGKNESKKNKIEPFPFLDACDYTFEAEYSQNKLSGLLKINDSKTEHQITVALDDSVNLGEGLIQLNIFDRDVDSMKNTFIKAGIISGEDKNPFH